MNFQPAVNAINAPEKLVLNQSKDLFLKHLPDFKSFSEPGNNYLKRERNYKDDLVRIFGAEFFPLIETEIKTEERALGICGKLHKLLYGTSLPSIKQNQNMIPWRSKFYHFLPGLSGKDAVIFVSSLRLLLDESVHISKRIDNFVRMFWPLLQDTEGKGGQNITILLTSFLLMLKNPDKYFVIQPTYFNSSYNLAYGKNLFKKADILTSEQFSEALKFVDMIKTGLEGLDWKPKDMIDVQGFLWVISKYDKDITKQEGFGEDIEQRFWVYSPGALAEFWKKDREQGVAAIGWGKIGDLRQYEDVTSISKAIHEKYPDLHSGTSCWYFAHEIKVGDIIIARQGQNKIIGRGKVISAYDFDPERDKESDDPFCSFVKVSWQDIGTWLTPWKFGQDTILKLSEDKEKLVDDLLKTAPKESNEAAVQDEMSQIVAIASSPELDQTTKTALIQARIGQGEFRANVLKLNNKTCIFTGINEPGLLIAGHLKPWSKSNNTEKLDPYNGLPLTPTYDKLLDRGFISFDEENKLKISPIVNHSIRSKLNLHEGKLYILPSDPRFREYLSYHRDNIFDKKCR